MVHLTTGALIIGMAMDGESVRYLGRLVSPQNFRAFVYGANEQVKLVNSWDEFKSQMATGLWFASEKEVPMTKQTEMVVIAKKKRGR